MALVVKDRVKQTTSTTGTGTLDLDGNSAGFQTFGAALSNADTTYYALTEGSTGAWEVGIGTFATGSPNTLARTTVLASSNSGSAVNLTAGDADVFITQPAGKSAHFDANGDLILNQDPTTALMAATKEYVDTIAAAGIHYHDPVRVEKEGNLNATYDNGTSGVGATLTNAGTQAALVIDGVTMVLNDRVLIYEQTNAAHNGIYTVTNVGSASTDWVLTRATDADSYGPSDPDALGQGDAFFVSEGDEGAGETYVMTTEGTITFGTTDIVFSQISATQVYSAGDGLTLTGTTFAVGAGTGVTVNANDVAIGQAVGTSDSVTFAQVTAELVGNATTATAWETSRTVSLTGDVTGSATGVDGSGDVSIATTIAANSVALGTDTTGNYVADITAGNLIDVSGGGSETATVNVAVDLSELTTSTVDADGAFFAVVNASNVQRKLTKGNINISGFNNDANYDIGTVTSVGVSAGTGISVSGSPITGSGTITVTNTAPDQTVTLNQAGGVTITGTYPTFTISSTDTNTTYSAGTALDLVGTTFHVDLSELSTSTTDGDGDFFVVVDDVNAQRKLTKGNINISGFNNDAGYTTNVGDITGVTAGTNLTGGGTSGTVTINMATGGIGAGTYGSTGNGTKIDTITVDAYGRVTAVATGATGDILGVTAGSGLTGGGTSGTVTLNVGAGTGVTVAADTVSIGQDVATTASPSFAGLTVDTDVLYVDSTNDRVGVNKTNPAYDFDVAGNARVTTIRVGSYIYHDGDTNSYLRFIAADDVQLVSGGRQMLRMDEGTDPDRLRFVTDSNWTDSNGDWAMSGDVTVGGDVTATDVDVSGTVQIGSEVVLQESTDRADLLQITSTTSGWGGLQIRNSSNEGRWSFMTDGGSAGIYDDENNEWAMLMAENAYVRLYYNGSQKFATTSTGVDITGALTVNGSPIGGGGASYEYKNANYTASSGDYVLADTSSSSFTVTLPASPSVGDTVFVSDYSGSFSLNNLTIGRNGSTIGGSAADLVVSNANVEVFLYYHNSTWNAYIKNQTKFVDPSVVGLSGPYYVNEGSVAPIVIDFYDTTASYSISVTGGSYVRYSDSINWTVPSVSSNTNHSITVTKTSGGSSSTDVHTLTVVSISTVSDGAISESSFSSSYLNDGWTV